MHVLWHNNQTMTSSRFWVLFGIHFLKHTRWRWNGLNICDVIAKHNSHCTKTLCVWKSRHFFQRRLFAHCFISWSWEFDVFVYKWSSCSMNCIQRSFLRVQCQQCSIRDQFLLIFQDWDLCRANSCIVHVDWLSSIGLRMFRRSEVSGSCGRMEDSFFPIEDRCGSFLGSEEDFLQRRRPLDQETILYIKEETSAIENTRKRNTNRVGPSKNHRWSTRCWKLPLLQGSGVDKQLGTLGSYSWKRLSGRAKQSVVKKHHLNEGKE